jgi:hypothetical protein
MSDQWVITVMVPADLPEVMREVLASSVADAVYRWEPADRDGWDVDVSASVVKQPRDGVYVRVSDEPVTKTWEPFEGVHVDMDAEQRPVGFEFLAAKSVEVDGDQVAPPPSDEAVIEDLASRMRLAYNGCSAVTDQWRHVASVAVAHLAALGGEK